MYDVWTRSVERVEGYGCAHGSPCGSSRTHLWTTPPVATSMRIFLLAISIRSLDCPSIHGGHSRKSSIEQTRQIHTGCSVPHNQFPYRQPRTPTTYSKMATNPEILALTEQMNSLSLSRNDAM